MSDSSQLEQIAKSVRGLKIAVWVLVIINVLQASAWFVPFLAPEFVAGRVLTSTMPNGMLESWAGMTLEDKIKRSSIILITEYKADGGKLKAIIKDVRKLKPDTVFHYQVGDEYGPMSVTPKVNTTYGDGSVVLLTGSPATMRESYGIFGGSITGLDEMPLSKFLELVDQSR
jgi:hypothetical protein